MSGTYNLSEVDKTQLVVISNSLKPFVGSRVNVTISEVPMTRDGFHSQITITGVLEGVDGTYRVLGTVPGETANPKTHTGNYVYFESKDFIGLLSGYDDQGREYEFKDGASAAIFIQIKGVEKETT